MTARLQYGAPLEAQGGAVMTAGRERPTFIVRLRPEPDVADSTRALRWALKVLLRRFGMRAISIEEDTR